MPASAALQTILMRRGFLSPATSYRRSWAIATGAVELMVVDVQCIMPSLPARGSLFPYEGHLD